MDVIDPVQLTALKQQIALAAERLSAAGIEGEEQVAKVAAQMAKSFNIRNNEGLHKLIRQVLAG